MADQTELRMNLVAIQRSDPYAKDIINSSAPTIFINNRLNTNSLVEPINGQIELQSQPPFLLYRNERSRIRGFWFYNNSECDRIRDIISKLVAECNNNSGGGAGPGDVKKVVTSAVPGLDMGKTGANGNVAGKNVDIFTMLTRAQEDFNNSTGKQPPSQQQPQQQQQQQQEPVPSRNLSAAINIVQPAPQQQLDTPQSVVNFFAAAKQPAASEVPLFQTLMSNPVHTLEQIEKQHRATTPQKDSAIVTGKLTPEVSDLENSFKLMGIPISSGPAPSQELGTSPLATFLSSTNLAAVRNNNQPMLKTKPIEISELESRQHQQQHQQPLHELLKKSDPMNNSLNASNNIAPLNSTPNTGGGSATKPALMPPTMFTPGSKNLTDLFGANNNNGTSVTELLVKSNSANNNHHAAAAAATMPPGFFPMAATAPSVEPLTQAQLIQAISYLIKHDPDFVRKLHEAYLKSFQAL
ncbi:hypothetical protein quinque_009622 [Culex quinquefasciatus]